MFNVIKITVIVFCILIYGSLYAQNYDGLVGYWKFDESSGKETIDEVSKMKDSIHYIFNNERPLSDPLRKAGVLHSSLDFDGFSSWIERPATKFYTPTKSISIAVWIAPRAFENGDSGKLSTIVNQQNKAENAGFVLGLFRHGKWSLQFGNGNRWIEVWDNEHPLPRHKWSYLIGTYSAEDGLVSLFLNGQCIAKKQIEKGIFIKPAAQPLVIGKHNQTEQLEMFLGKYPLNTYCGLMDELKIYSRALTEKEIQQSYLSYIDAYGGVLPSIPFENIKIDRNKYKDAPFRPQFHAIPPGCWMNEPHAPIFYNGKYHLTYQHNPTGPYWHHIHWGHWDSDDLVHWKDLPEAICPENDTIRPDGIWSGSAFYDQNGVPVYAYTFGNWSKTRNQGVAFAHPVDPNDPDLKNWIAETSPAITQNPDQGLIGEFRDPFIWRDKENGKWYALVGSGIPNEGGTAWCYITDDLKTWQLKVPFYLSDYKKYPFLGSIWELPVFLPIGKYQNGDTRYVMIISPKGLNENVEVYYWLGRFDRQNYRFIPDDGEPRYWNYGENSFIGPSGMIDPKTGRALIFTVVGGGYGPGWAGCASLPEHIFLDGDGKLGVKPVEELKSLRSKELFSIKNASLPDVNRELKTIHEDLIEIILEVEVENAGKCGIKVLQSPDSREETSIYYDSANKKLKMDVSKSTLNDRFKWNRTSTDTRNNLRNHFEINGETLKLHIYIDKSLIEVFANDKNSITRFVHPSLLQSNGMEVFADNGKTKVKSLEIWKLNSIYY
jgi:beta-fructofuranosidase